MLHVGTSLFGFRLVAVHTSQKAIVFRVGSELQGVLIVGEQGIVTVGQVSQSAAL